MKKILLSLLFNLNIYSKIILKYDGFIDETIILNEIDGHDSENSIKNKLKKFNFKKIEVTKKNKDFIIFIEDNQKINELEFNINFIEKNLIKNIKYIENPSLIKKIFFYPRIFFFNTYLDATKLNIKNQESSQITKDKLDNSTKNLKKYFLSIGYTNISITYEIITIKDKNILIYNISLNKIETIGIKINEKNLELKKELNTIIQPFNTSLTNPYENFSLMNFKYIVATKHSILKFYKDYGYLDVKVYSYFDKNSKKLIFNIEKGKAYKLKYDLDTLISYEKNIEKIDHEELKKIEKILKLNININEKKYKIFEILKKIYLDKKINISINNYSFKIKITTPKYIDRIISKIQIIENSENGISVSVKNEVLEYYLSKKVGDFVSENDIPKIKESISFLFKNVNVSLKKDKNNACILILTIEQKIKNLIAPSFAGNITDGIIVELPYENIFGLEYGTKFATKISSKNLMFKWDLNVNIYNSIIISGSVYYVKEKILNINLKYDFISVNLVNNSDANDKYWPNQVELILEDPFNIFKELYNIIPKVYTKIEQQMNGKELGYLIELTKWDKKYISNVSSFWYKINLLYNYKYSSEEIIDGLYHNILSDYKTQIDKMLGFSLSVLYNGTAFEDKLRISFEVIGSFFYDKDKHSKYTNLSGFFTFGINLQKIISQFPIPLCLEITYHAPFIGIVKNKGLDFGFNCPKIVLL